MKMIVLVDMDDDNLALFKAAALAFGVEVVEASSTDWEQVILMQTSAGGVASIICQYVQPKIDFMHKLVLYLCKQHLLDITTCISTYDQPFELENLGLTYIQMPFGLDAIRIMLNVDN